jgi:hypothetical protein
LAWTPFPLVAAVEIVRLVMLIGTALGPAMRRSLLVLWMRLCALHGDAGAAGRLATVPSTLSGPAPSPTASFPAESTLAKNVEAEWSEMLTIWPTLARAVPMSGLSRLPSPAGVALVRIVSHRA